MMDTGKMTVKLDVTCMTTEKYIKALRDGIGGGYVQITYDGRYWHAMSDVLHSRGNAPTLEKAIANMLNVPDDWRFPPEDALRPPMGQG